MQWPAQVRQYLQQQVAVQLRQRPADDWFDLQEVGRVCARLDDDIVRLLHDEQHTVRLNRSSKMNLFALAIGERGLPEGGRCKRDRGQLTPPMFPRYPDLYRQDCTGPVWRKGFAGSSPGFPAPSSGCPPRAAVQREHN